MAAWNDSTASWRGKVSEAEADALPGAYYVTAIREDGRHAYLLGPFIQRTPGKTAHSQALGLARKARRLVADLHLDDFHSLRYGTARLARLNRLPVGKLNDRIQAPAAS